MKENYDGVFENRPVCLDEYLTSVAFERRRSTLDTDKRKIFQVDNFPTDQYFDPNVRFLSDSDLGPYELGVFSKFISSKGPIAFIGGAGSGKSSVLQQLESQIKEKCEEVGWEGPRKSKTFVVNLNLLQISNKLSTRQIFDRISVLLKKKFVEIYFDGNENLAVEVLGDFLLGGEVPLTKLGESIARLMKVETREGDLDSDSLSAYYKAILRLSTSMDRFIAALAPYWMLAKSHKSVGVPLVIIFDNLDHFNERTQQEIYQRVSSYSAADNHKWMDGVSLVFSLRVTSLRDQGGFLPTADKVYHHGVTVSQILRAKATRYLLEVDPDCLKQKGIVRYGRIMRLWAALVEPGNSFGDVLDNMVGTNIRNGMEVAKAWVSSDDRTIVQSTPAQTDFRSKMSDYFFVFLCDFLGARISNALKENCCDALDHYGEIDPHEFKTRLISDLVAILECLHVVRSGRTFSQDAGHQVASRSPLRVLGKMSQRSLKKVGSERPDWFDHDHSVLRVRISRLVKKLDKKVGGDVIIKLILETFGGGISGLRSLLKKNDLVFESGVELKVDHIFRDIVNVVENPLSDEVERYSYQRRSRVFLKDLILLANDSTRFAKIHGLLRAETEAGEKLGLNLFLNSKGYPSLASLWVLSILYSYESESCKYSELKDQLEIVGFSKSEILSAMSELLNPDVHLVFSSKADYDVRRVENLEKNSSSPIGLTWAGIGYFSTICSNVAYAQWALLREGELDTSRVGDEKYMTHCRIGVLNYFNALLFSEYKRMICGPRELGETREVVSRCSIAVLSVFVRTSGESIYTLISTKVRVRPFAHRVAAEWINSLVYWAWLAGEIFDFHSSSLDSEIRYLSGKLNVNLLDEAKRGVKSIDDFKKAWVGDLDLVHIDIDRKKTSRITVERFDSFAVPRQWLDIENRRTSVFDHLKKHGDNFSV